MGEQPTVTLRDGRAIPRLGFGVFRIPPGEDTQAAVEAAVAAGYRHVDTAAVYRNEADVGAGIRASGVAPGSVWVTTKLANADQGAARARRAFEASLERLSLDGKRRSRVVEPVVHASLRRFVAEGRVVVLNQEVAPLRASRSSRRS
jgi:hypothetical protein